MQSNDLNGPHNFVQHVPDHCDRIVWRNAYYHLQANQAPAVPSGWKLVPEAPTEAMINAGVDAALEVSDIWMIDETGDAPSPHIARWAAMLAAAPQAPDSEQVAEDVAPEVLHALRLLYANFPTDNDLYEASWEELEIEAACNAYELAGKVIDRQGGAA